MNEPPFVYCYGIGPEHQPCLVRQHCQRYVRLREVPFHIPANPRWHLCGPNGEHFLPVETPNEPAV